MMTTLDISRLRREMAAELERRCCSAAPFSYARERGGSETLYGLTGTVNVLAALGLPLGNRSERSEIAARILERRKADGTFDGGAGPGHGLHMVLGALNLLGADPPENPVPLAPISPLELPSWLELHDWSSTHKELCGQTIPLLASDRVDAEWINVFVAAVAVRLDPERPLKTWCAADAPAWQVISCLYHVLAAFDAGRIPYPKPELLCQRLQDLHWDEAPENGPRTVCTDGDWAWLLLRLSTQLPQHAETCLQAIRRVSERRVQAWHNNRRNILCLDTHHLFCYLWSTAVFQSCIREHYVGGFVRDTLNDPALFRIQV